MKKVTVLAMAALLSAPALAQQGGQNPPRGRADPAAMEQRMQEMREQMAAIRETEDPEERQRLMRAHMERMHENMAGMREAMQGREEQRQQCAQSDIECEVGQLRMQHETMERRMGMMQMMMEHMMEHMQLQMMGSGSEAASATQEEHNEDPSHQ